LSSGLASALAALTRPVSSVQIVANFLYSRILMRFPTLKVVFAETSLSWGAYEIETADHQFERQRLHLEGYDMTPSQMFHRQCYMTGWYDRTAIEARHYLGVDNILEHQLPAGHLDLAHHPGNHCQKFCWRARGRTRQDALGQCGAAL
jgi:hypothetical protein